MTAASEGKLEDEARKAIEEALMSCEDWLYEEETYQIMDATVFDDRLAQIEGLMHAHLPPSDNQAASKDDEAAREDDDVDN